MLDIYYILHKNTIAEYERKALRQEVLRQSSQNNQSMDKRHRRQR